MECAQINVTGGGSTSPATVSFPGAYKGMYYTERNYSQPNELKF